MEFRKFVLSALILAALAVSASAQTGEIRGAVHDSSGATIPRAQIEVVNLGTQATRAVDCNGQGLYTVPFLQPGEYRAKVTAAGFQTLLREGLRLEVGQSKTVDFELQVSQTGQSVTVSGDTGQINMTDGSVSTVIDRKMVENLPLNGRSFNTLLELTPGVVVTTAATFAPGQFSVNGQRTSANYFMVDGASANFGTVGGSLGLGQTVAGVSPALTSFGGTNALVSVDALQEFRILTSSFAPEFGRSPGGQVQISTRSGTNAFHGGVFEYFRNEKMDANDWFANSAGKGRSPLRQNDFGGFLGGRVIKDKTFFFISYEGMRILQPQAQVINVPSRAARSAAPPTTSFILNAFPLPNGTETAQTGLFTGAYSNRNLLDAGSIRLDHKLTDRLSIFGRYNEAPTTSASRVFSLNTINAVDSRIRTITLGSVANLSPRLVGSFRFNYSFMENHGFYYMDDFGGGVAPPYQSLGPVTVPISQGDAFVGIVGAQSIIEGDTIRSSQRQLNLLTDFSWFKGNHEIKMGIDLRNLEPNATASAQDARTVATSVANVINDVFSSLSLRASKPSTYSFTSFSAFVQDSWKATQRLTLTYGLRWELNPAPSGKDGTDLRAFTNTNNLAASFLAPASQPLWNTRYDNFAPRIGVAYRLDATGRFVARAGWGYFYDSSAGMLGNLTGWFPAVSSKTVISPKFPLTPDNIQFAPFSIDPPYNGTAGIFDAHLKTPHSQQWNVALEAALTKQSTLSTTYVGQLGRELFASGAAYQPAPQFTGYVYYTGNGATSDYNALQVQFRQRAFVGLQGILSYTYSHSIDTASDDAPTLVSAAALASSQARGASTYDARHNFTGGFTYDLPTIGSSGVLHHLLSGWATDGTIAARTAFPLDVTTSKVFLVPTAIPSRADLLPGIPVYISDPNAPNQVRLNRAAFAVPSTVRQGTLGRDSIRGFGLSQFDLSIRRRFALTEGLALLARVEAFNVLNHTNFADPTGSLDLATFGLASSTLNRSLGGLSPIFQTGGPRSIQLSLKLQF